MGQEVKLSVKSDLDKIIADLRKLRDNAEDVSQVFEDTSKKSQQAIENNNKKVESGLTKSVALSRRVLNGLIQDMKALASLNALGGALKLSEQFAGSLKETISLSDAVRRLGASFGLTKGEFNNFQKKLTEGFGDIGLSSEDAAKAIQGLAGKGITGRDKVLASAKGAAQLAQLSGDKGNVGNIAAAIQDVIIAKGGKAGDTKMQDEIIRNVTKVTEATGKGASEILDTMRSVAQNMPKELRDKMSTAGLAQLSVVGAVAGEQALKPLQEYLSMSAEQRSGMEAQGVGKLFNLDGTINMDAVKSFQDRNKKMGVSDELAAKTLGFSEEGAAGFVRLINSTKQLENAFDRSAKASDDYEKKSRDSMGMLDAFKSSINKVKSTVAGPLTAITQGGTDLLSSASESTAGSMAVVGGAAILGSVLAGGGLRGVGGMLGGEAKRQAYEGITGRKVQDVNVVNASEIAGAQAGVTGLGGVLEKAGKVGALAKGAGMVGAAGYIGYQAGSVANEFIDAGTQGTTSEGFQGNAVERLFFKLDKLFGGEASASHMRNQKVLVELNTRDLKAKKQSTRGSSN